MRIGWLHDLPEYIGGAERTMSELASAAPDSVDIIACDPGHTDPDCDRYVIGNVVSYTLADLAPITAPAVKYHNDVGSWVRSDVTEWLQRNAAHVCCSPLQAEYMGIEAVLIPPPVDLSPFYDAASRVNGSRAGAVTVGSWRNHGKGARHAFQWGMAHGGIECFGDGPFAPPGSRPVAYEDMPALLARYRTFVHLPSAIEPFGRTVVEAWAAGCELVVNDLVGARYWITEAPDRLDSAAEDFWRLALS